MTLSLIAQIIGLEDALCTLSQNGLHS